MAVAAIALAAAAASCGSPDDAFLGNRYLDKCDSSWPVCDTSAGCKMDNSTYIQASFPGEKRMLLRTGKPAEVRVSIFLQSQKAAGTLTEVEWYETGCGTRYVEEVTGVNFFKEAGDRQEFTRSKNLTTVGDHFIRVQSDSTADYLLKLDVTEH